jgi:hypothetical protein
MRSVAVVQCDSRRIVATTTDWNGSPDLGFAVAVSNYYLSEIEKSFPSIRAIYVSDSNGGDLPKPFYDSFHAGTVAIKKHSEWMAAMQPWEMSLRFQAPERFANSVYKLITGTSLGNGWGWCDVVVARKFSGWRVTAMDGCSASP